MLFGLCRHTLPQILSKFEKKYAKIYFVGLIFIFTCAIFFLLRGYMPCLGACLRIFGASRGFSSPLEHFFKGARVDGVPAVVSDDLVAVGHAEFREGFLESFDFFGRDEGVLRSEDGAKLELFALRSNRDVVGDHSGPDYQGVHRDLRDFVDPSPHGSGSLGKTEHDEFRASLRESLLELLVEFRVETVEVGYVVVDLEQTIFAGHPAGSDTFIVIGEVEAGEPFGGDD